MRKLIFIMSILSIFILSCGKKENSDNKSNHVNIKQIPFYRFFLFLLEFEF